MPDPAPDASRRVFVFGVYLIILNISLIYILAKIWPPTIPPPAAGDVALFGLSFRIYPETRNLLIAILSGALGSYIHLATSFSDYVGSRRFISSWTWWYVLRPFIGAALAVIVYFTLRAGLVGTGSDGVNPYGVAAVAGLTGMFSKQATYKLREVFENFFRTQEKDKRSDPLDSPSGAGSIAPPAAPPAAGSRP